MTQLTWDAVQDRVYETGVDRGVLYIPDPGGAYSNGVAWNGLTSVTESPSGAEESPQYADNIKYLSLYSAEEFGCTIEAFTYPKEFNQFDGLGEPTPGLTVGQQPRKSFGFSWRTIVGNPLDGTDFGYKLHMVYGATASPSEKNYATINDSPEAINFSWEVTTVPVPMTGFKPTALLVADSTILPASAMQTLESFLWGTVGTDPSLPIPDDVAAIFAGALTEVTPTEPAFDGSDTITIPSVAGVTYYIEGIAQTAGAVVITEDTLVAARPNQGYIFPEPTDSDWLYVYTP